MASGCADSGDSMYHAEHAVRALRRGLGGEGDYVPIGWGVPMDGYEPVLVPLATYEVSSTVMITVAPTVRGSERK